MKIRICFIWVQHHQNFRITKMITDSIENSKEEENKIKKLIRDSTYSDNIILLGNQKYPEEFLKIADVFIHASLYEGKANAINEALACGLPTLVPNIKLYRDYVPQICSKFYNASSMSDLSEKMKQMSDMKQNIRNLSYKAREHANKALNPEVIAEIYYNLLRDL